jgi:PIN domain nuclease of toxin-antitoxin system
MGLLLDTNVLIALMEQRLNERLREALLTSTTDLRASVASLWEIAIKVRLGKLTLNAPLERLPELLEGIGLALLTIKADHVLAIALPEPPTRDPFDRLLLAQCSVEGLQLVTLDRALASHPLVWQSA